MLGDQPRHIAGKPDSRAVIAPARSFSSNQTRRGGSLFHEILITCAGDAPEDFGQSAARLGQRARLQDKPPQADFERPEVEHARTHGA
jgi:hypothetical protein